MRSSFSDEKKTEGVDYVLDPAMIGAVAIAYCACPGMLYALLTVIQNRWAAFSVPKIVSIAKKIL